MAELKNTISDVLTTGRLLAGRAAWGCAAVAWAATVLLGLDAVARHAWIPGPAQEAAPSWPGAGLLPLARWGPTLVVFVHPDCPCSGATVEELSRFMAAQGERTSAIVVASGRLAGEDPVRGSDTIALAGAIPGVMLRADGDGSLRRAFGARTSGAAFLYSPAGRLMFSGGITGSRGHAGDNDSLDALVRAVRGVGSASGRGPRNDCGALPVFGCELDPAASGPISRGPTSRGELK